MELETSREMEWTPCARSSVAVQSTTNPFHGGKAVASERSGSFGFVRADDAPIPYLRASGPIMRRSATASPMDRSPITPMCRFSPCANRRQCRVAIVTTAAPFQPDKGDQGAGAPYNAAAKFYTVYSGDTAPRSGSAHLACGDRSPAYDRRGSRATYFPLAACAAPPRSGRVGEARAALSWRAHQSQPSHHARDRLSGTRRALRGRWRRCRDPRRQLPGLPSERSALRRERSSRHGIATVVMGCAKDIVEYVGVPRFSSPISRSAMPPGSRRILHHRT